MTTEQDKHHKQSMKCKCNEAGQMEEDVKKKVEREQTSVTPCSEWFSSKEIAKM